MLVCLAAGVVEVALVFATAHTPTALTVTRAGLITSAVCALAGGVGFFQKPRTIGNAVSGLGVVVGVVGLLLTVFVEVTVAAFSGVSF